MEGALSGRKRERVEQPRRPGQPPGAEGSFRSDRVFAALRVLAGDPRFAPCPRARELPAVAFSGGSCRDAGPQWGVGPGASGCGRVRGVAVEGTSGQRREC